MDRIDDALLVEAGSRRSARRLSVGLARDAAERRAAQQLRWRIFAGEMGALLHSPEPGLDQDEFDAYCDHLVVRDGTEVVGTYRILAPEAARQIGSYYSETEFDLSRLQPIRGGMAELGRSCIDPRYRSGAVITLLWAGISRYVLARGYEYMAGCASMSAADGGDGARALYDGLAPASLAPREYRVFPKRTLPVRRVGSSCPRAPAAPLMKGYLRCGAYVCGEPAWDPEFDSADFFVLLPVNRMAARYARHFLGEAQAGASSALACSKAA